MKKYVAAITALIISLHYSLSAIPVTAGVEKNNTADANFPQKENQVAPEEPDVKDQGIQLPQNLDIFLDPWEINGKGQIYSETHVIRNTGHETVDISLTEIVCTPGRNSGTQVKTGKKELQNNEKKNLYLEMVVDNGTKITISEKGTQYQTRLEPGASLPVYFTGALNEASSEKWKDGDIHISMKCSWSVEKQKAVAGQLEETDALTEKIKDASPVAPDEYSADFESLY